jgi:hypothetical protein
VTRIRREPVPVERRDDTPVAFRWRGQRFVVHEVLDRWTETGQWWRSPEVLALTSGDSSGVDRADRSDRGGWVAGEQDWWRVEAGTDRPAALSAGPGVYDLCHETASGAWTLVRVQD